MRGSAPIQELEAACEAVWREWAAGEDADLGGSTSGDGLTRGSRAEVRLSRPRQSRAEAETPGETRG